MPTPAELEKEGAENAENARRLIRQITDGPSSNEQILQLAEITAILSLYHATARVAKALEAATSPHHP